MSREDDFAAVMLEDSILMAILTGGVHTSGNVGLLGITREAVPSAFSDGFLLPTALVKQRGKVPTLEVVDFNEQITSARQIVEVWLYADSGFTAIDAAKARLYTLFFGHTFDDTFEIRLANEIDRAHDLGALAGASLARMDWQVDSIIR